MSRVSTAMAAHRDDGALGGRVRDLPVGATPFVVAVWSLVAGALLFAWQDRPGPVIGTATAGLLAALAAVAGRPSERFAWLVPPTLRLVEYGTVVALTLVAGDGATKVATFVFLLVLSLHHYDAVYRFASGRGPSRRVVGLLGGWEGRTALLLGSAAVEHVALALWALAGHVGVLAIADSVWSWRQRRDEVM